MCRPQAVIRVLRAGAYHPAAVDQAVTVDRQQGVLSRREAPFFHVAKTIQSKKRVGSHIPKQRLGF